MAHPPHLRARKGYTLTEALITITILGVLSTLLLSSLLRSDPSTDTWRVEGKSAAGLIMNAYAAFEMDNAPTTATTWLNILPYINFQRNFYGSADVTIDAPPNTTAVTAFGCSGTTCVVSSSGNATALRLKNGAVVVLPRTLTFNGTGTLNALPFLVDPDGKVTGTRHSAEFWLYADGSIRSVRTLKTNTSNSGGMFSAAVNGDPAWLDFSS